MSAAVVHAPGASTRVALQALAFAAMAFGFKLWLIGRFGNSTPFWDQWDGEADAIYLPYLEGRLGLADLAAPHNEHRILTARLLALGLVAITGVWEPLLQMAVNALLHVAALLACVLMCARAASRGALAALLAFALALVAIPFAWENTLAGFQSSFYLLLLFSFAAIGLLVGSSPLAPRWWLGVACSIAAFFSLASGAFAALVAALVSLAIHGLGVRRGPRQLAAIALLGAVFIAQVLLIPAHPGHEVYRAHSLVQFAGALSSALGWPLSAGAAGALVRNLPGVLLLAWVAWRRPPAHDPRWLLAALVLWAFTQAAALALGRASGTLASRYTDLHAIALVVNFASLLVLAREWLPAAWRRPGAVTLALAWSALVLLPLAVDSWRTLPGVLAHKAQTGLEQEKNLRDYLRTGDFAHLTGKERLHIPYANPHRLAALLRSGPLRAMLPANVRPPLVPEAVESVPPDAFTTGGLPAQVVKPHGFTLGSYGPRHEAAEGKALLRFAAPPASGTLAIPVRGHSLAAGIRVEIERDGRRETLGPGEDASSAWIIARVPVPASPFALALTDADASAWIAVAAPSFVDRVSPFMDTLLRSYALFLAAGAGLAIALALLAAWRRPAPPGPA